MLRRSLNRLLAIFCAAMLIVAWGVLLIAVLVPAVAAAVPAPHVDLAAQHSGPQMASKLYRAKP